MLNHSGDMFGGRGEFFSIQVSSKICVCLSKGYVTSSVWGSLIMYILL